MERDKTEKECGITLESLLAFKKGAIFCQLSGLPGRLSDLEGCLMTVSQEDRSLPRRIDLDPVADIVKNQSKVSVDSSFHAKGCTEDAHGYYTSLSCHGCTLRPG
ncbi:hypothetical protein H920_18140 [Fukomys damarensis]|uniref:Uncharacterized protein n=1 Tax=Fukomys damarensis TaxID=885580 RepID=A0A091CSL5_FUKDA|nr:hypothetical protein H920_18140 [Fukomys damarensis]